MQNRNFYNQESILDLEAELYNKWDFESLEILYEKYYTEDRNIFDKYINLLFCNGKILKIKDIYSNYLPNHTLLNSFIKNESQLYNQIEENKNSFNELLLAIKLDAISSFLERNDLSFLDKTNYSELEFITLLYFINESITHKYMNRVLAIQVINWLYNIDYKIELFDLGRKIIIKRLIFYFENRNGDFYNLPHNYNTRDTKYLLQLQSILCSYKPMLGANFLLKYIDFLIGKKNNFKLKEITKPKVAICISGMYRSNSLALKSITENIQKVLNADIFIHTWDQWQKWPGMSGSNDYLYRLFGSTIKNSAPSNLRGLSDLTKYFPNVAKKISTPVYDIFSADLIDKDIKYNDIIIENEDDFITKFNIGEEFKTRGTFNQVKMFYGIYKAFSLLEEYERKHGIIYDYVIRCRPDFAISSKFQPSILENLRHDEIALDFLDYGPNDQVYAMRRDTYKQMAYLWHKMIDTRSLVPLKDFRGYDGHSLMYLWMKYLGLTPTNINLKRDVSLVTMNAKLPDVSYELEIDYASSAKCLIGNREVKKLTDFFLDRGN